MCHVYNLAAKFIPCLARAELLSICTIVSPKIRKQSFGKYPHAFPQGIDQILDLVAHLNRLLNVVLCVSYLTVDPCKRALNLVEPAAYHDVEAGIHQPAFHALSG